MAEQNPRPVVVAVGHDLHAALERAHDLVEGMPVTAELRIGRVVPTIVDMAKEARLIVLERRDLSTMMRVATRSVSSSVAARDRVLVVSVPSHWSPTRSHGGSPLVTVGVDVPERAEQVLRPAAAEAKSRGAVLRVLHTWSLPSAYDDIIFSRTESREWADRATAEIQIAIEAGRETELLVIGRHDQLLPIGSHLGPIARAVLREADSPVLLVGPRPSRGWKESPRGATEGVVQPA